MTNNARRARELVRDHGSLASFLWSYAPESGPATSQGDDAVLTAFVGLEHHTQFPRRWVVPMSVGRDAAFEFLSTGQRPSAVRWLTV
jgi:hypothetical protein